MQVIEFREEDEYYFKEGCHILELLNDESDSDLSVARARVEPGTTTRWHKLINTVERYLIQSGKGRVFIDEEERDVCPGSVVIIPAERAQRIMNTGEDDLVFLAICSPRFVSENYIDLEK